MNQQVIEATDRPHACAVGRNTDLWLRVTAPREAYASTPYMRLVTYDRGGQRRLGAIFEGEVVDLPDAVGHPAFPTTLEGLVSSSRGTVMDAARTALARDDVEEWRVRRPRILSPLFPASLLSAGSIA